MIDFQFICFISILLIVTSKGILFLYYYKYSVKYLAQNLLLSTNEQENNQIFNPIEYQETIDTVCQNDGILLPNNTCHCLSYYSGIHCQSIVCLNGGFAVDGICRCPSGYPGLHCEPCNNYICSY